MDNKLSTAALLEISTRMTREGILKTPEDYLEFLNNPNSEKSLELIYQLFLKENPDVELI